MQQEIKVQIIEAANLYMKDKGINAAGLSDISSINTSYLSVMLRGVFTTGPAGAETEIADKWFNMLAKTIGFDLGKVTLGVVVTPQFEQIIEALEDAKNIGLAKTIIGETGCGKTFSVNKFCISHPQYTYRITVSSVHTLAAILDDILEAMGESTKGRDVAKLKRIAKQMQKNKNAGGEPVIIIDEAENLKANPLRMIKALYDAVVEYGGLVLIGTPELQTKLIHLKSKQESGMPQLYRRLRAGIKEIKAIGGKFDDFYEKHVTDKGLRKLLSQLCDNYGTLNDYLLPVMRYAKEKEVPLTEDLFRVYHNIPK